MHQIYTIVADVYTRSSLILALSCRGFVDCIHARKGFNNQAQMRQQLIMFNHDGLCLSGLTEYSFFVLCMMHISLYSIVSSDI